MTEALLDHGADVNAVCSSGTALRLAVGSGFSEVARLLLERGADAKIEQPDASVLQTPLLTTLAYQELSSARVLLEAGADVNHGVRDNSPLRLAAYHLEDEEAVRLVLEFSPGPDVNMQDTVGDTVLNTQAATATSLSSRGWSSTGPMSSSPTRPASPRSIAPSTTGRSRSWSTCSAGRPMPTPSSGRAAPRCTSRAGARTSRS
ncbi:hypothetical protein VTI74DRAFT_10218 [Chaetomium olivicolor]